MKLALGFQDIKTKVRYIITYTNFGKKNVWIQKNNGITCSTTRKMRNNRIVSICSRKLKKD